jgi:hypothetical protein
MGHARRACRALGGRAVRFAPGTSASQIALCQTRVTANRAGHAHDEGEAPAPHEAVGCTRASAGDDSRVAGARTQLDPADAVSLDL